MRYKTFADQVLTQGYRLHPETVVIDIAEVGDVIQQFGGYAKAITGVSLPPFERCFLEVVLPNAALGIYAVWDASRRMLYLQSIQSDLTYFYISTRYMALRYDAQGCVAEEQGDVPEWVEPPVFPAGWLDLVTDAMCKKDAAVAVAAFYLMHQRSELSAVSYSRQVERQIERKTGKKPSPHYILHVKPGQSRRVAAAVLGSKSPLSADRHAHLVRGHFRINPPNHPLPQFAGKTFWIPAHQRGESETGKVEKIYRIVPPNQEGDQP